MILLQGFYNGKEFEFDDGVPGLHVGKFATVEGKGMVLLLDVGTNLLGRGIGIDIKGFGKVGICKHDLLGEELFELVKGGLALRGPGKLGILLGETGKGREKFRVTGDVVFVVIDHANEGADLFDIQRK